MKIPFNVDFYEYGGSKPCYNITIKLEEKLLSDTNLHSMDPVVKKLLNLDYKRELSKYNIDVVWVTCLTEFYSCMFIVSWNTLEQEYEVL